MRILENVKIFFMSTVTNTSKLISTWIQTVCGLRIRVGKGWRHPWVFEFGCWKKKIPLLIFSIRDGSAMRSCLVAFAI